MRGRGGINSEAREVCAEFREVIIIRSVDCGLEKGLIRFENHPIIDLILLVQIKPDVNTAYHVPFVLDLPSTPSIIVHPLVSSNRMCAWNFERRLSSICISHVLIRPIRIVSVVVQLK